VAEWLEILRNPMLLIHCMGFFIYPLLGILEKWFFDSDGGSAEFHDIFVIPSDDKVSNERALKHKRFRQIVGLSGVRVHEV